MVLELLFMHCTEFGNSSVILLCSKSFRSETIDKFLKVIWPCSYNVWIMFVRANPSVVMHEIAGMDRIGVL